MEVVTKLPHKRGQTVESRQSRSPASAPSKMSDVPKKPDSIFIWSNPLTFTSCKPFSTSQARSLPCSYLTNDAVWLLVVARPVRMWRDGGHKLHGNTAQLYTRAVLPSLSAADRPESEFGASRFASLSSPNGNTINIG